MKQSNCKHANALSRGAVVSTPPRHGVPCLTTGRRPFRLTLPPITHFP